MSNSQLNDNPNPLSERLLTIKQAADYLKCSKVYIYLKRREGKIETITLSKKKVLITKESLDAFLVSHENEASHG